MRVKLTLNLSENARRGIVQPVEKLLAELLGESMSLTAQSWFLRGEISAIKSSKLKTVKRVKDDITV